MTAVEIAAVNAADPETAVKGSGTVRRVKYAGPRVSPESNKSTPPYDPVVAVTVDVVVRDFGVRIDFDTIVRVVVDVIPHDAGIGTAIYSDSVTHIGLNDVRARCDIATIRKSNPRR